MLGFEEASGVELRDDIGFYLCVCGEDEKMAKAHVVSGVRGNVRRLLGLALRRRGFRSRFFFSAMGDDGDLRPC